MEPNPLDTVALVKQSLEDAKICLETFVSNPNNLRQVTKLAEEISQTFRNGGKVLVAGNGGSMADAMHFAEELTGRFRLDRRPLPAIALTDPTHLSCVANDFGFDHVFSRLTEAYAQPGDILLLLSTSGNSKNLLLAALAAQEKKATVWGFIGRDGGALKELCQDTLIAPGQTSDRIQEIQMLCLHILVEAIESLLEL